MIDPLNVPKGGGLDFANLDVRHLGQKDGMTWEAVTQATRNLAERDFQLNEKMKEVIGVVNNKEQIIPVPTATMTLPSGASEVVHNFRIPAGFEARILNAAVASNPSNSALLEIFFAASSFGATTGTSIVSSLTEFSGETMFHGIGEFVIKLTNTGSTMATVSASVVVSMRPTSETSGALLSAGAIGPQGKQGVQGKQGPIGPIGNTGAQGRQGLNWRGSWGAGTIYYENDAVSHTITPNGSMWSFIATRQNVDETPQITGIEPWDILASAAGTGQEGPPGASPTFGFNTVYGTIYTQGDYVQGPADGPYVSLDPGTHIVSMLETVFGGGQSFESAMSILSGQQQLSYKGTVTLKLPAGTWGASTDYFTDRSVVSFSGSNANCRIMKHDTAIDFSNLNGPSLTQWGITCSGLVSA